jgi:hypothetical protein
MLQASNAHALIALLSQEIVASRLQADDPSDTALFVPKLPSDDPIKG